MQTSMVIESLLNHVKNDILRDFSIIETFVFDDSLDFRERAIQYLAREGVFQTLEGETPDDWIMFIWTRSPLVSPTQVVRPHKAPFSNTNDEVLHGQFDHRLAQVDITCKMCSNSIEVAETIEEHMFVHGGERIDFVADYGGVIGQVRCSAEATASTNFEAEPLENSGTVVAVTMDLSITFPVLIHPELYANITTIPLSTKLSDSDESDNMTIE